MAPAKTGVFEPPRLMVFLGTSSLPDSVACLDFVIFAFFAMFFLFVCRVSRLVGGGPRTHKCTLYALIAFLSHSESLAR